MLGHMKSGSHYLLDSSSWKTSCIQPVQIPAGGSECNKACPLPATQHGAFCSYISLFPVERSSPEAAAYFFCFLFFWTPSCCYHAQLKQNNTKKITESFIIFLWNGTWRLFTSWWGNRPILPQYEEKGINGITDIQNGRYATRSQRKEGFGPASSEKGTRRKGFGGCSV